MQYEIYQIQKEIDENILEWRWRLVKIVNKKILAVSHDGFPNKIECEEAIFLMMTADYKTPIIDLGNITKMPILKKLLFKVKPNQ